MTHSVQECNIHAQLFTITCLGLFIWDHSCLIHNATMPHCKLNYFMLSNTSKKLSDLSRHFSSRDRQSQIQIATRDCNMDCPKLETISCYSNNRLLGDMCCLWNNSNGGSKTRIPARKGRWHNKKIRPKGKITEELFLVNEITHG